MKTTVKNDGGSMLKETTMSNFKRLTSHKGANNICYEICVAFYKEHENSFFPYLRKLHVQKYSNTCT
jgi:hypothetical protein